MTISSIPARDTSLPFCVVQRKRSEMIPFQPAFFRLIGLLIQPLLLGGLIFIAPASPSSAAPPTTPLGAGGIPIYVLYLRQIGLPGSDYSAAITGALQSELARKASCTNVTSQEDIANLVNLGRQQQTVGTPEDKQVNLDDIAAALGRVGWIISGSFGKAGNNYFVNIIATDANTGKTIDNQMTTAPGESDDVLIDLIEKAVSQMNLKVCRSKWTGTITVTEKSDYFLQKPGYIPILANATRNSRAQGITYSDETEVLGATITQYTGAASGAGKIDAKLTRTINESGFIYNLATQDVDCSGSWGRQMRGDFEWRPWMLETDTTWRVDARDTRDGAVTMNIDGNGSYRITVVFPSTTYKRVQRSFGRNHPTPCEGPKNIESPEIQPEMTAPARTITLEGKVDPKNPDQLIGENTENTPEWKDPMGAKNTGSLVKKWSLTANKQ